MPKVHRAAVFAFLGPLLGPFPAPATAAFAQGNAVTLSLHDAAQVQPHNVTVKAVSYRGSDALEVRLTGPYRGPDTDTFAFVPGLDFHDGTIEVDVAGTPLPGALPGARGFVGVAFRIDAQESFACESFYIRPTNGRAEDQVRRNHSTQYFSYPGFDFDRLRGEAPGQYESYADLVPGDWTHLRIEVSGATSSAAPMRTGQWGCSSTTEPTATSAICPSRRASVLSTNRSQYRGDAT
jgi:hypothetical protein